MPPNSPEQRVDYKIQESYSSSVHEYVSWVKNTEEIKRRLVEFWQSTYRAFEWKNAIFVFPLFPGSAVAHVVWGDVVKCLLIVYIIGNISAKKNIKMRSRLLKL